MLRHLIILLALAAPVSAEPLQIVTDIGPVQSLVARVWGDVPSVLAGPDTDPHDFQFRPSQVRALATADILFLAGPDLSPWLADEARSVNPAIIVRPLSPDQTGESHPWLDPRNAAGWLTAIAAELAALDPQGAALYRQRASDAQTELAALERDLDAMLEPARHYRIVVAHDAYGPLASRFGLTIAAAMADSHGRAPGAAHLARLRAQVVGGSVDCIFAEPGEGQDHARLLTGGSGIPVGALDPLGRDLPPGPGQYTALMRALAAAIAGCAR